MRHFSARSTLLIIVAFVFALGTSLLYATPVQAQGDNGGAVQSQDSATQPTVGRVSVIRGNVSIQRGDSGDWIAATVNTPLMAGDRISTGNGSRAEVQLDYADVLRLDENSSVKITDLTGSHIQLQIGEGVVEYAVIAANGTDTEIDTPNAAVHPLREGDYRIQISDNSDTQVTVRRGQAEVSEPQGSTQVQDGQLITIQGTDNPQYQVSNAPGPDSFDRWNADRDHSIEDAQSWQHIDRYYTGSEDLDQYGHWESVPDYGQVWVPEQNSGWAPYRDGSWEWEPYWGWTWVSYEPWGWAPYHYGRWFVWDGAWAWWPGPIGFYGGWGYRPIWSPAYVSFFGWGGGVSFGFGFGNIGWLPCGPGDFFTPWWGFGVTQVNFVNITIINRDRDDFRFRRGVGDRDFDRDDHRFAPLFHGRNGFSNISHFDNDARIRSGVSSVRGENFGRGDAHFQRGLSTQQFQKANFMTGKLPAVPARQSLGKIQQHVSPGIARTASFNNSKFYSQSRASFTPKPFNQQVSEQQRIIANSRTNTGARMPAAPAQQRFGTSNNARVNASSRTNGSVQTKGFNPPAKQTQNGWRSFGGNNSGARPNATPQSRIPSAPAQQRPNTFEKQMPSVRQNPTGRTEQRPSGNQNGWHQFTPPAQQQRRPDTFQQQAPNVRQGGGQAQPGRPGNPGDINQQRPSGNQNQWRQFHPPAQQQARPSEPNQPRGNSGRPATQSRPNWSDFSRSNSRPDRGFGDSRPQLNMRQPIATPRNPSYYGGSSGREMPHYSAPQQQERGSYSAPRGGFGGRQPSFGGRGGGNFGGGGHPSFGGRSGGSFGGGSRGGSHPSGGGSHRPR